MQQQSTIEGREVVSDIPHVGPDTPWDSIFLLDPWPPRFDEWLAWHRACLLPKHLTSTIHLTTFTGG